MVDLRGHSFAPHCGSIRSSHRSTLYEYKWPKQRAESEKFPHYFKGAHISVRTCECQYSFDTKLFVVVSFCLLFLLKSTTQVAIACLSMCPTAQVYIITRQTVRNDTHTCQQAAAAAASCCTLQQCNVAMHFIQCTFVNFRRILAWIGQKPNHVINDPLWHILWFLLLIERIHTDFRWKNLMPKIYWNDPAKARHVYVKNRISSH